MTVSLQRRLFFAALLVQCAFRMSAYASDPSTDAALTSTISGLDGKVFDAYNRCDLSMFGRYFAADVEFYHDQGGATFDRKSVVENTKKFICNKVHRQLIATSLRIYPIKNFGAIEEGEHRFCDIATGNCEGIAKFVIVWRRQADHWQITRVLSYGHRTMTEAEKTLTE